MLRLLRLSKLLKPPAQNAHAAWVLERLASKATAELANILTDQASEGRAANLFAFRWQDLNLWRPAPKAGALSRLHYTLQQIFLSCAAIPTLASLENTGIAREPGAFS
jgi:hypothetical protein